MTKKKEPRILEIEREALSKPRKRIYELQYEDSNGKRYSTWVSGNTYEEVLAWFYDTRSFYTLKSITATEHMLYA